MEDGVLVGPVGFEPTTHGLKVRCLVIFRMQFWRDVAISAVNYCFLLLSHSLPITEHLRFIRTESGLNECKRGMLVAFSERRLELGYVERFTQGFQCKSRLLQEAESGTAKAIPVNS